MNNAAPATGPFHLSTEPLVGIFAIRADKLVPLPILGYRDILSSVDANGPHYGIEWIPVGYETRAGRKFPRCQSVYRDQQVFDALNAKVSRLPLYDFPVVVSAVNEIVKVAA